MALVNGAQGDTIAFHGNSLLYHSSGRTTAIFESIDVDTQVVTPIGTASGESYCMGYRGETIQMYGSNETGNLYTVNIGTGARTIIGPFSPSVSNRGLAFGPLAPTPTPPTLGNYPNATVTLSGNTTVTPDALPTDAAGINVSTDTNFKGTFVADPATGVVRVTDAQPAGTYTVTVKALNEGGSMSKTFTLTVQNGTACLTAPQFGNAADVGISGSQPRAVAIGDFNNDGKQDLVSADIDASNLSVRIGNGTGGFTGSTSVNLGSGRNPNDVAIGDFNNDGNQDFATANQGSDTVSIILGDGWVALARVPS